MSHSIKIHVHSTHSACIITSTLHCKHNCYLQTSHDTAALHHSRSGRFITREHFTRHRMAYLSASIHDLFVFEHGGGSSLFPPRLPGYLCRSEVLFTFRLLPAVKSWTAGLSGKIDQAGRRLHNSRSFRWSGYLQPFVAASCTCVSFLFVTLFCGFIFFFCFVPFLLDAC